MAERLTRRAETDGVKAVWYGDRDVFLEGEVGYAEADKLAQYEDLGFTPEEVALLAKFYKEHTSVSAITADIETTHSYGHECDKKDWMRLLKELKGGTK